jgi:long-subunit acyl-CoA synthetase (AMP-forming)
MNKEASVDDGELTPTLKVRRFNIEKMYADIIENMYSSIGGWK